MKNTLIIIFLLIGITSFSFSQNAKLIDFIASECDKESDPEQLRIRIISQQFKDNIFEIEIASTANCCSDFKPEIILLNDTLNLQLNEQGENCECNCCFQFIYKINGLEKRNYNILFNSKPIKYSNEKYHTYPITYFIHNGDTTGHRDKYGKLQGTIIQKRENHYYHTEYKDNEHIKWIIKDLNNTILYETTDFDKLLLFKEKMQKENKR